MSKQMGKILGLDKEVEFHFDVYSDELKQLISKLNDNHVDANARENNKMVNENGETIDVFDPHGNHIDDNLTK